MDRPTRRIPDIEANDHVIKWGTATLGPDAQLKLHIVGVNEPIVIVLTQPVVLGRADENNTSGIDVDLTPYGAAAQGVSRQHAVIELLRKTVMLTDLNSTNGTYLNEQRVLPQQRRVVRDSDEIRMGKFILHIYF